ncbi:MAG: hypothetical protein PF447_09590 [Spirochaetaceae bacterium]|nr:hypothetical protein [Spirochaetaceae bacterium]
MLFLNKLQEKHIINIRMAALMMLSATSIAYQLAVMRSFAVGSWSTFGSMVISIALLGIGMAGTLLTFLSKRVKANIDGWLQWTAGLQLPAMALAHILAQKVPFNPVMIASNPEQLWWIGVYYLIYAVPFFISALFISTMFIGYSKVIHKLYFWNMAGSGLGGFILLLTLFFLPTDMIILPLLIIAGLSTLAVLFQWNEKKSRVFISRNKTILLTLVMFASCFLLAFLGQISISEYKGISYARQFPDSEEVYSSMGPEGEFRVFKSSFFHFAPGLSDNAFFYLDRMPKEAFLGLYIDGGGPIGMMGALAEEESRYIDFLPMNAPYLLKENPSVLVLQLGGGIGVHTALHHDPVQVDVVESSRNIMDLQMNNEYFQEFNGDFLHHPVVQVHKDEPRAFSRSTKNRYDIVEMSLTDSVGLSSTGGYPLMENYGYTAEGFQDYLSALKDDGIFSVTVWNRLSPPRNVPRLLSTCLKALELHGVDNPGQHIYVFSMLYSTATVLIKNSPFTADEIDRLNRYNRKMSFDVSYYPGMVTDLGDEAALLQEYSLQFADNPEDGGDMLNAPALIPAELYGMVVRWILNDREDELYKSYVFDIRPARDNRPYYTGYFKWSNRKLFQGKMGQIPEEWGYMMNLATLGMSLIFGLLIILIPMATRWKELFSKRKGTGGIIVYFVCLGLAFMFVEIYLMQKLVFFLGNPIYSTSIVITSMLIISGLGSLYSSRFKENPARSIKRASWAVAGSMLFYLLLMPMILRGLLGLPFILKMLLTILFIAPSAFFMGMFFPTGLSQVSQHRPGILPWAWGVNGALSVTGSVLTTMISLTYGFHMVLILVMVLYLLAGLVFPATMRKE